MSNNNQNIKKIKNDSSLLDNNNSTENENKINNDNSLENDPRKNIQNKTNKKAKNKKKALEPSKANKDNEKDKLKPEKKKLIIETKIIDELPKNQVRENKSKNAVYKIVFVFHNQDILITVKPELIMINLIKRLSKKLNLPIEQLSLSYKNYEITEKYNDMTVKEFFDFPKNKSRPIIYVKIKQSINNSNSYNNINSELDKYSAFYKRSYDNKVKIKNYPSMSDINVGPNDDIYNIINTFLKDTNINSDFTCERKEENKDNKNNNNSEINSNNNNIEKQDKISNDINENNENENNENENNENDNNNSAINEQNSNLNSEINNNIEENKTEFTNSKNINKKNNNNFVYYIGFPTPDIAFDFNRYMNSLRLMNPTFKNIKVSVLLSKKRSPKKNKLNEEQNDYNKKNYQMNYNYRYGAFLNLDEKDLEKRNIEVLNMVRNNFLNNKMNGLIKGSSYNYLNISSPYSTPYDERIKDMHENKKKWLSPRGFISSVNKYSGVHI